MERRKFLQTGAAAGLIGSAKLLEPLAKAEQTTSTSGTVPKRKLGKTGEQLSIVSFAGIIVMDNSPSFAANIVSEAVDRGINHFDVAPTYGNGSRARILPCSSSWEMGTVLSEPTPTGQLGR